MRFTGIQPAPGLLVIPLFIPHQGCPNTCLFCDQRKIAAQTSVKPHEIRAECRRWLELSQKEKADEISFYGGSFTALPETLLHEYIEAGKALVAEGLAGTLRCSTRPDAVTPEIAALLKQSGFSTVELGAQTLSDRLLTIMQRGHTGQDTIKAAELLTAAGLSCGLQFMCGHPGELVSDSEETCRKLADISFDFTRIYPFLPIPDTAAAAAVKNGSLPVAGTAETIERAALLFIASQQKGAPVVRIGLPQNDILPDLYPHNLAQVVIARVLILLYQQGYTDITIPERWRTSYNLALKETPKLRNIVSFL